MPRKNPTSVALSGKIQKLKNELAGVYGLKNLLSAGVLLFNRLTDSEQKNIIKEVNRLAQPDDVEVLSDEQIYEKLKQHFQFEPGGNKTQITSAKKVVRLIAEFRQRIPPVEKPKQQQKIDVG